MFRVLSALSIILVAVLLTSCTSKTASSITKHPSKIHVVTSLDFYGETSKAVLGNKGTVKSIINKPSMDPHEYEATTKTAKIVSDADVIIYNGLGYDTWMTRIATDTTHTTKINVGQTVMGKPVDANQHIWYNLKTMPTLAKYLVKKYSKLQPQNKAYFEKNAKNYIASLKPLQQKLNQLKKNANGAEVDVSEPVFDYTLNDLGYKVADTGYSMAVENDTDPSPAEIKAMQQDIKTHKIKFFVVNTQEINQITKNMMTLAKKDGVPILKVTESMPAGKTYESWMMSQFKQLEKIQKAVK
ncbi:metal ABC transporter substrate-binding protein [Secundilactobacillus paracollinoides]|uniref:Metal ABC transporter substrate-binding protein n=1 Tax=Secundilactobacillus paracollinoides TaxID=240427 RepID=A0A1B2IXQ4_9LACO|nr:metal ABC transporter substrate-binding protein [Secundilactobacillus paracollinoides]ANZ66845.1 metal ABC transporter substrate-binding protein [Secundilactobacillus paracollinoides]